MARLGLGADLAADVAAPVEGAAAPLPHDVGLGLEAPAAAHQVAAVHPDGRGVALPPAGAVEADGRVVVAEVGRGLEVDEVPPAWLLVVGVGRVEVEAAPSLAPHVAFVPFFFFFFFGKQQRGLGGGGGGGGGGVG